jgi:hypothetical protein
LLQIRLRELSELSLRKTVEDQESHIESLMSKLTEAQEVEAKMEENYRMELKAQTKVAQLYKGTIINYTNHNNNK